MLQWNNKVFNEKCNMLIIYIACDNIYSLHS